MYRTLDSEKIVATARQLQRRIAERFPEAGLRKVSMELSAVAEQARDRSRRMARANWPLRLFSLVCVALGLATLVVVLVTQVRPTGGIWELGNFLQNLEAAMGSIVFIGAAVIFMVTVDLRIKRRRALEAIHELRALAHIVDMHQLTKDPETTRRGPRTPASPVRTLTAFELNRYLDYCSEMLSIISKIGALYAQRFTDPVVLTAVDEVETLTTGLSRKIWQKIMILDRLDERAPQERGQAEREPA